MPDAFLLGETTNMEPQAYNELYRLEPNHWWYRGMRRITSRLLGSLLFGEKDVKILDAGCGVGGNLSALSYFGFTVGLDYSRLALEYASAYHAGRLARASVGALPYADNSFDLLTSFDVIYCREVEDDVSALREFARVTRPGGHVLVRVPAMKLLRGPHDDIVHGVRRYTAAGLSKKMECAHLLPLRLTYANSLLMPLIFLVRKLQMVGVGLGAAPKSDVRAAPQPINNLLTGLLYLEAGWIGSGRSFPAGVSLFGLAVKPIRYGVN
jgi:SAM-dependent methyltransferase